MLHSTIKSSTPCQWSQVFQSAFLWTSNSVTDKCWGWRRRERWGGGVFKPKCLNSHHQDLSFPWKESCRDLSVRELYNHPFKYLTTYPPCSRVCFRVAQIHFGTGKHSFLPCWCTRAGSHHCPWSTHPCLRNTQQGWVSITASTSPPYQNQKGLAQCLSPEKDKLRHSHSSQRGSFMVP